MSKRFTITGHRSISDHQKKRLYDLSDFDGMISVTECLNELDGKNNELKEFIRNLTNYKGEILLSNGRAYKREYVERLLE